ncbi:hypothetical protein J5F27_12250 [Schleiferilactobacillus harbinensis]|jgi:hypothetical protein|uniref:Uncharacterized protein n=1 Tax=Schleiferilactobacillus harbinensis TaxID=304207 RepID=A0ABU7SYW5_9LACO|nr:hypothetical protein [Schleiferilactobacillus harbinensis]MBO3092680.1 hypothetical protein [Schleiferilactobacillus harbinensis]MCI1686756.1 hypothetical protein [Schleiferilactobacillus harbinensis]MCI1782631.1 hypothetical protein [Schleiferilactobacillus harbinensis]MCI1849575.1 hypothetical protein [Schleiferilactobacillus harbinensis]GEK07189.1 hypothetical protein LHA01_24280 [Schleiferilactobacillus harbinensis]
MPKQTQDLSSRSGGLAEYKQAVKKLHSPQQFAKEMAALGFTQFQKGPNR